MPSDFAKLTLGSAIASFNRQASFNPFRFNSAPADPVQREYENLLPEEQEVLQEKASQDGESSLLMDILDLPSKLAFFYSITGAAEAVASGEDPLEAFARGSPFAFMADALGINELFTGADDVPVAQKKTFRDIRLAAGDTDPDEEWYDTVINILGDVALDPSTYILPFAKIGTGAANVSRNAHKGILRLGEEAAAGATRFGRATDESLRIVDQTRRSGMVAAKDLMDKGRVGSLIDPKTGVREFPEIPGTVFDPTLGDGGVIRQATTLLEKMKSGSNALFVMRFPFDLFGASNVATPIKVMPRHWENRIAQSLTRTAEFLRTNPVTSPLFAAFSATQPLVKAGASPGQRQLITDALEGAREVERAQLLETKHAVKVMTNRFTPDKETQKLVIDLMEHRAYEDDFLSITKKFEEGYAFSQAQARGAAMALDKRIGRFYDLAEQGNEHAIRFLYDEGLPLGTKQLDQVGLAAREGVDVPGFASKDTLADSIKKIADDAGVDESKLLSEEQVLGRAPGEKLPAEEVVEGAQADRMARLLTAKDAGTLEKAKDFAKGLRGILDGFMQEERRANILNTALEGYFPRVMSREARDLLDTMLPNAFAKTFGKEGRSVVESFTTRRTVTNLSTIEFNDMVSRLGTKKLGNATPGEILEAVARDNPDMMRQLKQTDPDAFEFFNTDIVDVVMARARASGKAVGKAQMNELLFSPEVGIARAVTDSKDLARVLQSEFIAPGVSRLTHTAFTLNKGGAKSLQPHDIMEQAYGANAQSRQRINQRIMSQDLDARLAATKGDSDFAIGELQDARRLKPTDDLSVGDGPHWLENKKRAFRSKKNYEQERAAINSHFRGQRVVTAALQPAEGGGRPSILFRGVDTLPLRVRRKVAAIEDRVNSLASGARNASQADPRNLSKTQPALTAKEAETLMKGLVSDANREIKELFIQERKWIKEHLSRVDGEISSIDRFIDGKLKQVKGQKTASVEHIKGQKEKVREGFQELRKKVKSNRARIDEERLLREWRGERNGFREVDLNDPRTVEDMAKTPGRKVYWVDNEVAGAMRSFMDQVYRSDFFTGRLMEQIDTTIDWWKRTTVLPFPQSRFRDLVSNFSMLALGGFRHPSAMYDAGRIQKALGSALSTAQSSDDFVKALDNVTVKVADDVTYTGSEILEQAQRRGLVDSGYLGEEMQNAMVGSLADALPRGATPAKKALDAIDVLDFKGLATKGKSSSSLVRLGGWAAREGDNWSKLSGFIDTLKRGMDFDEGAQWIKKYSYSSGHHLYSPTEKYILRRLIPFYSWTRFVTGQLAETYVTNPRSIAVFGKVKENAEQAFNLDDISLPETAPGHRLIADRLGIPLAMTDKGPRYLMFDNYLPPAELANIGAMLAGTASLVPGVEVGDPSDAVTFFAEKLSPPLKLAIEQATNTNVWSGRDLEFYPGEQGTFMGLPVRKRWLQFIQQVRLAKTINDLNVINLHDMSVGAGDAVDRSGPFFSDERSFLEKVATSGVGIAPKTRVIDIERETARGEARTQLTLNRAKAALKRTIGDKRPVSQENQTILQRLITESMAQQVRIDETRRNFGVPETR